MTATPEAPTTPAALVAERVEEAVRAVANGGDPLRACRHVLDDATLPLVACSRHMAAGVMCVDCAQVHASRAADVVAACEFCGAPDPSEWWDYPIRVTTPLVLTAAADASRFVLRPGGAMVLVSPLAQLCLACVDAAAAEMEASE